MSGYSPKETQNPTSEDTCIRAALFATAKMRRQLSAQQGMMDEVEVVHTCHGIALGRKKNEVWSSATEGMHLDGVVLSEVSQAEKDK